LEDLAVSFNIPNSKPNDSKPETNMTRLNIVAANPISDVEANLETTSQKIHPEPDLNKTPKTL